MINILKKMQRVANCKVFSPNIFGILSWLFVIAVFSIPEALRFILNNDNDRIANFKPVSFAFVTILLFIWSISNDYSNKLKISKLSSWLKALNWIVIPCVVICFITYIDVFKFQIVDIDMNRSVTPVILQMYLILILYYLTDKIRKNSPKTISVKVSKNLALSTVVILLAIMNIFFCMYFVFSWIGWYRNL